MTASTEKPGQEGLGHERSGEGPLSHIRVLDLTEFLAGPYATLILGDLGAEIIKVESPRGDSSRSVPPHFIAGSSTYYTQISRNKKSIVIDLKTEQGLAIAKELAAKCDMLIENRRPGVLARLGLTYEDLSRTNRGLIWCSISGFGQDGPDRDRAAYDMIVQGMSGVMSLTGEKGGKPVRAGVPIGDICAGMYGVIGILAALERRNLTGRGDQIDVAMLDVQVSLLNYQATAYLHSGKVPGTQGREHDFIPTYRCFEAGDGILVAVTANTDQMWEDLCAVLGVSHLTADERFADRTKRYENGDALVPLLEAAFKLQKADDLVAGLLDRGVSAGPVNTLDRALAEPQVLHRGMVMDLEGPDDEQRARVVGNPIHIRDSGRTNHAYPPYLGQNTDEVLSDLLGYDEARIDALKSDGVVHDRDGVKKAAE